MVASGTSGPGIGEDCGACGSAAVTERLERTARASTSKPPVRATRSGAAALAMVIYAVALPQRYDVACGAFAYTLIVTLAAGGEHSIALLASRLWETFLGGGLGLAAAMLLLPLCLEQERAAARHQAS